MRHHHDDDLTKPLHPDALPALHTPQPSTGPRRAAPARRTRRGAPMPPRARAPKAGTLYFPPTGAPTGAGREKYAGKNAERAAERAARREARIAAKRTARGIGKPHGGHPATMVILDELVPGE